MAIRIAAVAGQFYEASPDACRSHLQRLLPTAPVNADLPERIVCGIVPHAGWLFSGKLAALVFAAIKQQQAVDTFVILGAVHAASRPHGMLYDSGSWGTPLGAVAVDEELAEAIAAEAGDLVCVDCDSHSREHSIEVQAPIIQYLFDEAKIVPLMVPPFNGAHDLGDAVAGAIAQSDKNIVCIASTDLTHYGPSYGFTPRGSSAEAIRWAKEENDRFFINLALTMQADKLVDSALMYGSACGAGAVAATVAAAQKLGAEKGYLLAHTTSAEVFREDFGKGSDDSVGYAAMVFG